MPLTPPSRRLFLSCALLKPNVSYTRRTWEQMPLITKEDAMFRQGPVLFATDFSHYALYALKYAVAVAKKYGNEVHVTHILDSSLFSAGSGHGHWVRQMDLDALMTSMREHAEDRLAHLNRIVTAEGICACHHIVSGKPAPELIRLAHELGCSLIVLATHGRTGVDHAVFGSVAERVVRLSNVPVLAIKHPQHEFVKERDLSFELQHVLFPTDFSDYAHRVLPFATSLCKEFDAELMLLHTNEIPVMLPEFMPDAATAVGAEMEESALEALEGLRGQLGGIRAQVQVRSGVPYREICRMTNEEHIDLIVMPTHGRTGVSHALFGSVAEKVVRRSRCPVLTVRPEPWMAENPQEQSGASTAG
jgi:nucleotide-binding universal stress UspA family protein